MLRHGLFGRRICLASFLFVLTSLVAASSATSAVLFSNGFETDTSGWDAFGPGFEPTRVPSGTNGVTSASGSFHAVNSPTATRPATNWGGENYGAGDSVPTAFQEYWTSLDIYLDVAGGFANDTRFDWDSAISDSNGDFKRDFIFNGGFYNDGTGPGANTNRFVISASNNSSPGSAFPKNPGRAPIAISTTGWYTFEHHFYDNAGVLAVDLSIYDSVNSLVNSWTLSNPLDLIGGVGGNQYGWFSDNDFSALPFDNSELRTATAAIPEPLSVAVWSCIALTLGGLTWWNRRSVATSSEAPAVSCN
jgi:hypothetical protein